LVTGEEAVAVLLLSVAVLAEMPAGASPVP